jgi:hypothetical protein
MLIYQRVTTLQCRSSHNFPDVSLLGVFRHIQKLSQFEDRPGRLQLIRGIFSHYWLIGWWFGIIFPFSWEFHHPN